MNKFQFLYIIFLIFISGCSALNQPKFQKKPNVKEFVISKYGNPNTIENKNEIEIWKYESEKILKNNRKIVFRDNQIIIHEKELKPLPLALKSIVLYGGTILVGIGATALILGHM